jgi:hypothetical protein
LFGANENEKQRSRATATRTAKAPVRSRVKNAASDLFGYNDEGYAEKTGTSRVRKTQKTTIAPKSTARKSSSRALETSSREKTTHAGKSLAHARAGRLGGLAPHRCRGQECKSESVATTARKRSKKVNTTI